MRLFVLVLLLYPSIIAFASGDQNVSTPTTPVSSEQLAAIEENSTMVQQKIGKLSGFEFNYSPESIKWLDGFIERNRQDLDLKLVNVLGSYLGEAIKHNYGGTWVSVGGTVGLQLPSGLIVFPFAKVAKQISHGKEDSISTFVEAIPTLNENQSKNEAKK